ncbi:MAG: hypothetical protein ACRC62_28925 [Microcoleus sp.]
MTQNLLSESIAMSLPSPSRIDDLLNYLTLGSMLCGVIGSAAALGVDFLRRRVRGKAAEYAASHDFKLLRSDLIENHDSFREFLKEYRSDRAQYREDHLELCQRVAKVEAKIDA